MAEKKEEKKPVSAGKKAVNKIKAAPAPKPAVKKVPKKEHVLHHPKKEEKALPAGRQGASVEIKEKVAVKKKPAPKPGVSYYGTGRRKTAVARVWLYPGRGEIKVNELPLEEYARKRQFLMHMVLQPLVATKTADTHDVKATVAGGGVPSQIGAVKMGIARALLEVNPDFRQVLRRSGFLTRDPRAKERKKYGHKRARKSFQYSKR